MRIPRIYTHQPLAKSGAVILSADSAHYLSKVLRLQVGRPITLFNGDNHVYDAEIIELSKQQCTVQINSSTLENRESTLHTHLAVGVSRGERMDHVLQKATELGISEITPLFTERTEVKLKGERLEKKHHHWQQILISACEQCQRNTLPVLNAPIHIDQLQPNANGHSFVLHHRSDAALSSYSSTASVLLITGPEGGLSEPEIATLTDKGCHPLTLGPRVLRTETAPLVALSAVQMLWGDLS